MEIINTNKAPKAIGPYSQAIKSGNMLFVSGQIPLNPETMEIVEGGVKEQTKQCLQNVSEILKEAGLSFSNVVKCGVFIKDMNEFNEINEVYSTYFNDYKPARACVEVSRLPKDVKVEIEVIAIF